MQETKQTLYELITGVAFFFLLFLTGNIFASNWIAYTLGLLIGCVIAGFMCVHMNRVLQQATLYEEETAAKKVQKGTALRYLVMLTGLLAAIFLPRYISVIGVALGVLSLKFSAYLQPLTHKILKNL